MKKLALLLLLVTPVFADGLPEDVGPANSKANVTISAPGVGKVTCLTMVSAGVVTYGANTATFTVLMGGTTSYEMVLSTATGFNSPVPFEIGVSANDPLCGGMNETVELKLNANTFNINYKGIVRKD